MHGQLLKDVHVVKLETLAMLVSCQQNFKNPVNIVLVNPNIVSYYFSLFFNKYLCIFKISLEK